MTAAVFDAITFEAFINDAWTDISSDVEIEPSPKWKMGILDTGTLARVGDAEELSFSMNNGQSNSAGLLGYYTPGHPNVRSGWGPGVPVRLSFVYEGSRYYKFYGLIAPDGIKTEPGIYGTRQVSVTVEGFLAQAERHPLDLMTLQTNLTIMGAVPYVLANMPIQPLGTEYGTGVDTFPTLFDALGSDTRAVQLFQNLAVSEWGYIYTRADHGTGQVLVVEGRGDRTNQENSVIPLPTAESGFLLAEDDTYVLAEDGSKIVLEETQAIDFGGKAIAGMSAARGRNLANRIAGVSYPRRVDAAATTVLFALQKRIQVTAGQTVRDIRGRYRDPAGGASYVSGMNMVTPVSGTDYTAFANEDGTGTNLTANITVLAEYGASEVEYTITNGGVASAWVYVQARGRGIYLYDPARKIFEDQASIDAFGVFPLSLDMIYQDDPLALEAIGQLVLAAEAQPNTTVEAFPMFANRSEDDLLGFLALEPGNRVHFSESQTGVDDNYFIQGYSAQIVSGKYVFWAPVLKIADDTNYWQLDVSDLDTGTILDT